MAYILTCLGKADYTYPILGSQFFPSFDVYLQTVIWLADSILDHNCFLFDSIRAQFNDKYSHKN